MPGRLTLVTGGVRSGKSRFAEERAAGAPPVVYLATMRVIDDETAERVARHRARRPAEWTCLEAPDDLPAALAGVIDARTVLLDCLGNWVTSRLLAHDPPSEAETYGPALTAAAEDSVQRGLADLVAAHRAGSADLIVVTNEVGLGIVPATPLGRLFRDCLGLANCGLAAAADEVVMMVSGLPLWLKGRPADAAK